MSLSSFWPCETVLKIDHTLHLREFQNSVHNYSAITNDTDTPLEASACGGWGSRGANGSYAHPFLTAGKHVKCVWTRVTSQLHSYSSFLLKEIRQEASRTTIYQPFLLSPSRTNTQLIIALTNSATWHKSHNPIYFLTSLSFVSEVGN